MESFEPMVTNLCPGQEMLYKINQRGIIKNGTRQSYGFCALYFRVIGRNIHTKHGVFEPMVTKLCFGKEMLYKINQRGIMKKGTKQSYGSCALHFESLPETCIPSMESFEPSVTKLCSGQEMLYKINQRGKVKKRNKVELRFLCTAL